MNRTYWKCAGTIVFGSAALFALSGCWSRGPMPSDQTQTGAMIEEPSGTIYQSSSTYNTQPSAQASVSTSSSSDQGWTQSTPSATASTSTSRQSGYAAPVDNSSNSQWQRGSEQGQTVQSQRTVTEPSGTGAQYNAQVQTQPSASARVQTRSTQNWQQSTPSEGPNSGGKWRPGFRPPNTAEPAASTANGWLPGYYTGEAVNEPSGSSNWRSSNSGSVKGQYQRDQTQQQQYQVQPQQQQQPLPATQSQQDLNNQGQTPSNNSTTP
jgi:hypothetical protein